MNSRTSPTLAQGGRVLPAATPVSAVTPGWPSLRSPFCLWESSSLPLLPSPSRLSGPWDGPPRGRVVWRGTRFRGQMERGAILGGGVSSRESPEAVATAGSLAVGCGGSRPSLRKPGKWVGGRGKVVTGSGELRCSKAHTFKGILHYGLFGLHGPFLWEGAVKGLRF